MTGNAPTRIDADSDKGNLVAPGGQRSADRDAKAAQSPRDDGRDSALLVSRIAAAVGALVAVSAGSLLLIMAR